MNYNWSNWIPSFEPSSDTSKQCVAAVSIGNGVWQWQRQSCSDEMVVLCQSRPITIDRMFTVIFMT